MIRLAHLNGVIRMCGAPECAATNTYDGHGNLRSKNGFAGGGLLEHFERRSTNREAMKYALMVNGQKVGYIKQSFDRSSTPSTGFQATNLTNDTYYLLHIWSPPILQRKYLLSDRDRFAHIYPASSWE